MIEHMVMFKFSGQTTSAQKDEAIRLARELKHIPGVTEVHCNHNFSDRSKGYDVGLVVQAESKAALEAYGPHPLHQALVKHLKESGLEDIIVLDFEV